MIINALLQLVLLLPPLYIYDTSYGEYDKNILIIHSYHQNFEWTSELNRGIFDEIKPLENEYFVQIEYLDFKRYQNRELYNSIFDLMRAKYSLTDFDIVISSDDGALDFLREYSGYFDQMPKVFCGINNYKDELIANLKNITGVSEENDINATLNLILKLHPEKKKLVVLTDTTLTTTEVFKLFEKEINSGNFNFDVDVLSSQNSQQLIDNFNKYDEDNTVGLVLGYFIDEKGNFDSYQIRLNQLSENISIPLYGVWNFYIGHGIVGGKLTDSYFQGKAAGELANKILDGRDINSIPIIKNLANQYKFDFNYLEKFNISESNLPNNSQILNKPNDDLNISYQTLIASIIFAVFLITVVILLISYSLHKRKTEKSLLKAKLEAENANRLKTEFLAQMSHEIRTPVNTILSFSSLIKSSLVHKVDDDLNNCFTSIERGGRRLIRTIDLIIKMAEVQSGSIEIVKKEVKFFDYVLTPVIDEFRSLAYAKSLKLELINNSTEECRTNVDTHTMRQIIVNLLDNALKYTFNGGVKVVFSNRGNNCIIEIEDSGIGISDEYLGTIFEPFTQEEQGYTRKFEGNGLGMALVKRYCELNDAKISIESEKNHGTKVTVILEKLN